MKAIGILVALGVVLVVVSGALGGSPAMIGGSVAVLAQLWAVTLLRPKMRAPNPEFMARWLGGMAIRFLALVAVAAWTITRPASIPPVPALLSYLGVLLPLLFLETRFLR